ncbi:MAG: GNAT family N-acetyltransferase [Candidatus Limnocylindrales bacterium]|jgi:GNAT superfamily N-acetyltransferase
MSATYSPRDKGRGLGTLLLKRLAEASDDEGVALFEADVVAENGRMLEVFRESGFGVTMKSEPDDPPDFAARIPAACKER